MYSYRMNFLVCELYLNKDTFWSARLLFTKGHRLVNFNTETHCLPVWRLRSQLRCGQVWLLPSPGWGALRPSLSS